MLMTLHQKSWLDGLALQDYGQHCQTNEKTIKEMLKLAKDYHKVVKKKGGPPFPPNTY